MEKEPKDYEISFLSIEEKGAEAVLTILKQHQAEILLEGPVEKIALSYPIKHQTAAYFGYMHFRVSPDAAPLIRKDLNVQPLVLRSLVLTPPFMKPKPRWEMKARSKPAVGTAAPVESQPTSSPLSNEALEKKIEEILK